MSERKYQIAMDQHHRFGAQVTPDIHVAVKIQSETDPFRVEKGVYGQAVVTVNTSLGQVRMRFIHISKNPRHGEVGQPEFRVRWFSKRTGQQTEEGRPEYLDVAGPLDPSARRSFSSHILAVFHQVREMAAKGDLYGQNEGEFFSAE